MIRLFGTTIGETYQALARRAHLGDEAGPLIDDRIKAVGRILVSLAVVGAGSYVVVSGGEQASNVGSTMLGTVLGYWLK